MPNKIIVTSSINLSKTQLDEISSILNKKLNFNFPVENRIDSSIKGGFTIEVNDWFLDSSIRHDMETIRRSLLE